ncbi:MAG TPA: family 10 glycosylhydrolase [Firmicutes bacterium]|nr:family 10 glycosylhydrolase [Bacillota bacterium]
MRGFSAKAPRWVAAVALIVIVTALVPPPAAAQLPSGLRGLWVPRWGLADPRWVGRMVDDAAQAGFNALFVQVDGRGEAYYRSDLLPPADGLGDYDPLADILTRAHAKGLAVHAWINAFTVGLPGKRPASARHVLNAHPEWVTYDAAGQSLLDWDLARARRNLAGYFLDPGLPEVQDFVAAVVDEVARRYPVDGIHLDYIRYPGPDMGYHPAVRQAFVARYGVDPLTMAASSPLRPVWDEWRRVQVTQVVRRAAAAARLARPGILVSAAVFPSLDEARRRRYQDWPRWVLEGDLDFVAPMAYSASTPEVEAWLAAGWQAAPAQSVFPGLGAYKFGSDGAAFVTQLDTVLSSRPSGVMVYSYQALQQMPGVLALLAAGPFAPSPPVAPPASPAAVPAPPPPPQAPSAAE